MRFQIVEVSQSVKVVLLRQQRHADEGNLGFSLAYFFGGLFFEKSLCGIDLGKAGYGPPPHTTPV